MSIPSNDHSKIPTIKCQYGQIAMRANVHRAKIHAMSKQSIIVPLYAQLSIWQSFSADRVFQLSEIIGWHNLPVDTVSSLTEYLFYPLCLAGIVGRMLTQ